MGAMREYFLRIYRVGHGLCTLLHYHDDSTVYNAVIDCGYSSFCCLPAYNGLEIDFDALIEDIVQVVQGGGRLNLLVSSHQDADHNNMMMRLVSRLNGWQSTPGTTSWFAGRQGEIWSCTAQGKKKITWQADNLIEYRYDYAEEDTAIECRQVVRAPEKRQYEEEALLKFTTDRALQREDGSVCRSVFCLECHLMICETELLRMVKASEVRLVLSHAYENGESLAIGPAAEPEDLPVWLSEVREAAAYEIGQELGNTWLAIEAVQWLVRVTGRYIAEALEPCRTVWQVWKKNWEDGNAYEQSFPIERIIMGGDNGEDTYCALTYFMQSYAENMGYGICTVCPYYSYFRVEDFQVSLVSSKENVLYSNVLAAETGDAGQEIVTRWIGGDDDAIQKNATAAVVHFCYDQSDPNAPKTILFPGDVTVHNLPDIEQRLVRKRFLAPDITYRVTSMIAPHHGSFHTNIVCRSEGIAPEQPLRDLYHAMGQVSTYISECYKNDTYHVPRREYLEHIAGHWFPAAAHGLSCYQSAGANMQTGNEEFVFQIEGTGESIYNTGNLYWETEQGQVCYDYYQIDLLREPAEPMPGLFVSRHNTGHGFREKGRAGDTMTADVGEAVCHSKDPDRQDRKNQDFRPAAGADRSLRCLPPDRLFL